LRVGAVEEVGAGEGGGAEEGTADRRIGNAVGGTHGEGVIPVGLRITVTIK